MVPLNSGPTLPDIRAGLEQALTKAVGMPHHVEAFIAWTLGKRHGMGAFAEEAAASLASGGRSAADVATLGYGAALNVLTDDTNAALLDGLTWLGKRIWFRPQQAPTLEADGISSLGLALAVAKLAPSVDGDVLQILGSIRAPLAVADLARLIHCRRAVCACRSFAASSSGCDVGTVYASRKPFGSKK